MILLLLSGSAGGLADTPEYATRVSGWSLGPTVAGFLTRILAGSLLPVALLLLLAYIPDFDDPLDPSDTVQLGSTFAVFWLLMSLALVGAVLRFLWPRSGALEAVSVGGLVVTAQSLISWAKVSASGEAVQLALYTWMVWVSVCLVGAWVGFGLRQISESSLFGTHGRTLAPSWWDQNN